jgi:hypothetical protein
MARPKKPEGQAKKNLLRIRLTDEERATLDRAAREKNLETSTWARAELLTLARKLLRGQQGGALPGRQS